MSHFKSTSPKPSLTSDLSLILTYIKSEIMIAPVSADVKTDAVILLNQSIYDKPISDQPGSATEQWIDLDKFRDSLKTLLDAQYVDQIFVGLLGLPDSPPTIFGGTTVKGKPGWVAQQRAKQRRSDAMNARRREAAADLGGAPSALHSKNPAGVLAKSIKRGISALVEESVGNTIVGDHKAPKDSEIPLLDCLKEQPSEVKAKVSLRERLSRTVDAVLGRQRPDAEAVDAETSEDTINEEASVK